jgi:hypothetical protein
VARLVPVADPESHSCWSGYTPRADPHRCRESNRFASPRSFVDEERARGAGLIRFWETSALVKLYSATEAGYRNALRRLHGRKARTARQATSAIAAVELLSAGAAVPAIAPSSPPLPVEFITADEVQALLVRREATARRIEIMVVELPV